MHVGRGAQPTPFPRHKAWIALSVLLIGTAMSLLNSTIVNVALPAIRTSLNVTDTTLSWIISGWALAFGLTLIPAGRLGDRIGHKWVFFAGILLFTTSSIACGLAQSGSELVIARLFQGLAGGVFFPAVTVYIQLLFTGRTRSTAFGVMGAVIGVASAIGPLVGGALIEIAGSTDGWRLVFYVNVPFGLITLVATATLVPNNIGDRVPTKGLDLCGLLLLSVALVLLLVPLVEGQAHNWPRWTAVSICAAALAFAGFIRWEHRVDARGRFSLVPPRLLRRPALAAGSVMALLFFAAFVSIFFVLALLWQRGLGLSALDTGLLSLPFAVGHIVGALVSGRLSTRVGRAVLFLASAALTLGLTWTSVCLALSTPESITAWTFVAPLALSGMGSGLFISPNTQFAVSVVAPEETGAASAIVATMQRLGTAIGLAVVATVLYNHLARHSDGSQSFVDAAAIAIAVCAALAAATLPLVFALPRRT